MISIDGFLLTRRWRDTSTGIELEYWFHTSQGPLQITFTEQEGIFFVAVEHAQKAESLLGHLVSHTRILSLKTFNQSPVIGFYFRSQAQLRQAAKRLMEHQITPHEYDVRTVDRYLMERFINASVRIQCSTSETDSTERFTKTTNPRLKPSSFRPMLKVISFDIETAIETEQLYSIAVYGDNATHVFMVSDEPVAETHIFPNERSLLKAFLAWMEQYDPDALIGWNCINFDLRYLQQCCDRLNLRLELGRDRQVIEWRTSPANEQHFFALIPGRAVIDGIDMLKMATYSFESFSLDFVAGEILGDRKLIHGESDRGEEITRLYLDDKQALAEYNLQDCKLVWDIFEATQLIDFSIERANLTGLPIDKIGGSVAAFENQYLPKLHRQGYVAPNLPENPVGVGSPGGYVMNSIPGLYEHVLVFDFKSLYPSIIRTFHIDPFALAEGDAVMAAEDPLSDIPQGIVKGFNGGYFKKAQSILPGLIEQLWQARDEAKKHQNTALSQAIKIIMNSFYGVMGTPGCRFFDRRLPSSITLRGHEIMNQTKVLMHEKGYTVIYGDTDSIFIWLDQKVSPQEADKIGGNLAHELTQWWKSTLKAQFDLDSALELEYENHYHYFLMPTIRGSDVGTKKRYAGLIAKDDFDPMKPAPSQYELIFKGLETVRTDWTQAARHFQRELYKRVFLKQEYRSYVFGLAEEIRQGQHDKNLRFRKRLRRRLKDYQRNIPPHVQAACKADEWLKQNGKKSRYANGGWIEYVYTVNGPEPVDIPNSPLDYELYLERQIRPIADGILVFIDDSFDHITNKQIKLL